MVSCNHSLTIIITVCHTTLQEGLRPQTPSVSVRFDGSTWRKRQVRALSEELENPMNVHRWRKLEGSDPVMYELIQKVRAARAGAKRGKMPTTRVFPKKIGRKAQAEKKGGVQEQEFGRYFLFGNPNLNHFFQWIFGEFFCRFFHGNDWGVIC